MQDTLAPHLIVVGGLGQPCGEAGEVGCRQPCQGGKWQWRQSSLQQAPQLASNKRWPLHGPCACHLIALLRINPAKETFGWQQAVRRLCNPEQ